MVYAEQNSNSLIEDLNKLANISEHMRLSNSQLPGQRLQATITKKIKKGSKDNKPFPSDQFLNLAIIVIFKYCLYGFYSDSLINNIKRDESDYNFTTNHLRYFDLFLSL